MWRYEDVGIWKLKKIKKYFFLQSKKNLHISISSYLHIFKLSNFQIKKMKHYTLLFFAVLFCCNTSFGQTFKTMQDNAAFQKKLQEIAVKTTSLQSDFVENGNSSMAKGAHIENKSSTG